MIRHGGQQLNLFIIPCFTLVRVIDPELFHLFAASLSPCIKSGFFWNAKFLKEFFLVHFHYLARAQGSKFNPLYGNPNQPDTAVIYSRNHLSDLVELTFR